MKNEENQAKVLFVILMLIAALLGATSCATHSQTSYNAHRSCAAYR
jgi:hypothetical protein